MCGYVLFKFLSVDSFNLTKQPRPSAVLLPARHYASLSSLSSLPIARSRKAGQRETSCLAIPTLFMYSSSAALYAALRNYIILIYFPPPPTPLGLTKPVIQYICFRFLYHQSILLIICRSHQFEVAITFLGFIDFYS